MKPTTSPIAKPKISLAWLAVTGGSALLFAAFALLPFIMRSASNYFSVGSKLLGWSATGPLQSPNSISIGWQQPSAIKATEICSVLATGLLSVFVLWYARRTRSYRHAKYASTLQLIVTVAVIVITAFVYAGIRTHSQASPVTIKSGQVYSVKSDHSPQRCETVILDGQNASYSIDLPCTGAKSVPHSHFGYGIAPVYLVIDSVLYLSAPLLNWYRFGMNPRYIGGQKKGALFQ